MRTSVSDQPSTSKGSKTNKRKITSAKSSKKKKKDESRTSTKYDAAQLEMDRIMASELDTDGELLNSDGEPIHKKKKRRAPRKPKPYVQSGKKHEIFCVRTGFHSLFYTPDNKGKRKMKTAAELAATNTVPATSEEIEKFKKLLDTTVLEASAWMVESSIYINYCLNYILAYGSESDIRKEFHMAAPKDDHFHVYFKHLQSPTAAGSTNNIHPEYKAFREIRPHNHLIKGNIMVYAAKMFKTNFQDNVTRHCKEHVKKFLKHLFPGKQHLTDINNTIYNMFYGGKTAANPLMVQKVDDIMGRSNFTSMEHNWYSIVPSPVRLQKFNEGNELKNFTIIPLYKKGRKAVRIDTQTMLRLVNSLRKRKNKLVHSDHDFTKIWAPFNCYH